MIDRLRVNAWFVIFLALLGSAYSSNFRASTGVICVVAEQPVDSLPTYTFREPTITLHMPVVPSASWLADSESLVVQRLTSFTSTAMEVVNSTSGELISTVLDGDMQITPNLAFNSEEGLVIVVMQNSNSSSSFSLATVSLNSYSIINNISLTGEAPKYVAWNHKDNRISALLPNETIVLFDNQLQETSRKNLEGISGHATNVLLGYRRLAWSPNDQYILATSYEDVEPAILDPKTLTVQKPFGSDKFTAPAVWLSNGSYLFLSSPIMTQSLYISDPTEIADYRLRLFDGSFNELFVNSSLYGLRGIETTVDPSDSYLVSVSDVLPYNVQDAQIKKLRDSLNGKRATHILLQDPFGNQFYNLLDTDDYMSTSISLQFSPDGSKLLCSGGEFVLIWDTLSDGLIDNDGIPNSWELEKGSNPWVDDRYFDDDLDNLTTLEEYKHGADPLNPDTDGDTLLDGDEVYVYGTDPANPDTDGDGIPDNEDPINDLTVNEGFLGADLRAAAIVLVGLGGILKKHRPKLG